MNYFFLGNINLLFNNIEWGKFFFNFIEFELILLSTIFLHKWRMNFCWDFYSHNKFIKK